MTAIAERRITAEPAYYEVRCPETGEILGYLVSAAIGPLAQALEENGLTVEAPEPIVSAGVPAGVAA
jgi:hypothetical protein